MIPNKHYGIEVVKVTCTTSPSCEDKMTKGSRS